MLQSPLQSTSEQSLFFLNGYTDHAESITAHLKPLFCSSWYVLPLLGIAYVVLGSILPKTISKLLSSSDSFIQYDDRKNPSSSILVNQNDDENPGKINSFSSQQKSLLRNKAILAVTSTALIIKLSDYLQTNPSIASMIQSTFMQIQQNHPTIVGVVNETIPNISNVNSSIMMMVALLQWILLDGSKKSLLLAWIVSIGGPLSEIPFVWNGFWHYIPSASDYFPFRDNVVLHFLYSYYLQVSSSSLSSSATDAVTHVVASSSMSSLLPAMHDLSLSKITGPCYFAVTMEAIQLGRWFDSMSSSRVVADTRIDFDDEVTKKVR